MFGKAILRTSARIHQALTSVAPTELLLNGAALWTLEVLGSASNLTARLPAPLLKRAKSDHVFRILILAWSGLGNPATEQRLVNLLRLLRRAYPHLPLSVLITTLDRQRSAQYFQEEAVEWIEISRLVFLDLFQAIQDSDLVVSLTWYPDSLLNAASFNAVLEYGNAVAKKLGKPLLLFGPQPLTPQLPVDFVARVWHTRTAIQLPFLDQNPAPAVPQILHERLFGLDNLPLYRCDATTWAAKQLKTLDLELKTPLLGIVFQNPYLSAFQPKLSRVAAVVIERERGKAKDLLSAPTVEPNRPRFEELLAIMVRQIQSIRKHNRITPIIFCLSELDRSACRELARRLGPEIRRLDVSSYSGKQISSLFSKLKAVVTFSYDAAMMCLPVAKPFISIAGDKELKAVMTELGLATQAYLEYMGADFEARLETKLEFLVGDHESTSDWQGASARVMGDLYAAEAGRVQLLRLLLPRWTPQEMAPALTSKTIRDVLGPIPWEFQQPAQKRFWDLSEMITNALNAHEVNRP